MVNKRQTTQTGLLLLTVCCCLTGTASQSTTLSMVWLAPWPLKYDQFNASTSVGGFTYGLERVLNDSNILPGYDFDIVYKDSDCDAKKGIASIFEVFLDDGLYPDIIVGPLCTGPMTSVAQLAASENIPVFGWVSNDIALENPEVYTTLVTLLFNIASMGDGVVLLMEHFNWKRVFMISTTGGDFGELANGVSSRILARKEDGFYITRHVSDVEYNAGADKIREFYQLVKKEARIVILSIPFAEIRVWMLAAYDEAMADGEYVFLYVNQQIPNEAMTNVLNSNSFWQGAGDGRDADARQAYENLIPIYVKPVNLETQNIARPLFYETAKKPYWQNMLHVPPATSDLYSLFLHDCVRMYADLATAAFNDYGHIGLRNGTDIYNRAKTYHSSGGYSGEIIMSDSASRIPMFDYYDMDAKGNFTPAAETAKVPGARSARTAQTYRAIRDFRWGNGKVGDANKPLDTPECGFSNENCPVVIPYIIGGSVLFVLLSIAVMGFFVWRKVKKERDLNDLVWKLNHDDLKIYSGNRAPGSMINLRSKSQELRGSNTSVTESLAGNQLFITVAHYKGGLVALKTVRKNKINIDRVLLHEMRNMIEVKHANINPFIGACTDAPNIESVWEYCTKGSLTDVLWNENIALDDMFKFSIVIDIWNGLAYLHHSSIKRHGRVKSSNVVIDNRFSCKLTDWGLETFTEGTAKDGDLSDHATYEAMFWTAPEILRKQAETDSHIADPTPEADVYGAAIVCKEVFCRNSPYTEYDDLSPQEIIEKVRDADGLTESRRSGPARHFRPCLSEVELTETKNDLPNKLRQFIQKCWDEEPHNRPTAKQASKEITKINPFQKANVMDNMIAMMEKYSKQLEDIVGERTMELQEEKKKTELLLFRMLPKSVAEDLKMGKTIDAETFDSVTICFCDILHFTELTANCNPMQIVDILNGIYSLFDGIIAEHDVYKVETVGEVYVLASGLPIRNGDRHIVEICNCALDMLSGVLKYKVPHLSNYTLLTRIGIHTGPIVTGVVGLTMPRYCLFGDTINTASRMESNCLQHRIHLSPFAYKSLSKFGGYYLADRGLIAVKGKGNMNTYWLMTKDGYGKQLPDFDALTKSDNPKPVKMPMTTGKATNPTIRPSVESGFDEMSNFGTDSRKTSVQEPLSRKTSTQDSARSSGPSDGGGTDSRKTSMAAPQDSPSKLADIEETNSKASDQDLTKLKQNAADAGAQKGKADAESRPLTAKGRQADKNNNSTTPPPKATTSTDDPSKPPGEAVFVKPAKEKKGSVSTKKEDAELVDLEQEEYLPKNLPKEKNDLVEGMFSKVSNMRAQSAKRKRKNAHVEKDGLPPVTKKKKVPTATLR